MTEHDKQEIERLKERKQEYLELKNLTKEEKEEKIKLFLAIMRGEK